VSVRSELVLDSALAQAIRDAERQWLRDNQEAID
jgi:hypothetical protein